MKYIFSSTIILFCLAASKLIMHFVDAGFPAPLLAMVILLVLLLLGIVKEQQLMPCASPLLNVMPIFFIPAGVGFIEHLELIKTHWLFLTTVMILVPLSSLILAASIVGYFKGKDSNE